MPFVIGPMAADILNWGELLPRLEKDPDTYRTTRWPHRKVKRPKAGALPQYPTPDELCYSELVAAHQLNCGTLRDAPTARVRAIAQFIKFGIAQQPPRQREAAYNHDSNALREGIRFAKKMLDDPASGDELKAACSDQIDDHLKKLEKLERRSKMG